MKKALVYILFAAVLLSALCGCSKDGGAPASPSASVFSPSASPSASDAPSASSAPAQEPPQAAAEKLTDLGVQSFCAAMACWLSDYEDGSDLRDNMLVWDMTGWYAAWLYRTEGYDLISREQALDALRAFGGDGSSLPDGWEGGVVEVLKGSDGSVSYDFTQHKLEMDAMVGVNTEVSTETSGETAARTTVTYHYDNGYSDSSVFNFTYEKNSDEDSAFAYRLKDASVISRMAPATGEALPFTLDDLIEANDLKNVLTSRPSVNIRDINYDTDLVTWAFLTDEGPAVITSGLGYFSGLYKGLEFQCYEYEEGALRSYIGGVSQDPWEEHSSLLTGSLYEISEMYYDREEDGLIWLNCETWFDTEKQLAVEKDSLLIRREVCNYGESTVITEYDYSSQPPEFELLKNWDDGSRTVTVEWDRYVNGESVRETQIVTAPAAWEFIPFEAVWGDYTVYMDEGFTRPYEYPGDGVDYTIYVTASKG